MKKFFSVKAEPGNNFRIKLNGLSFRPKVIVLRWFVTGALVYN
ncbi:MAG: hypothetical protein QY308_03885 [Ignavibacteriaceae bacterium]|nr:MAG: hypothetical protein QY308_03885 [Ignavibacteriaceae bacterium]